MGLNSHWGWHNRDDTEDDTQTRHNREPSGQDLGTDKTRARQHFKIKSHVKAHDTDKQDQVNVWIL